MHNFDDVAFGGGGADDLHMASGDDYAQGEMGRDYIWGGQDGGSGTPLDWLYGNGDDDFIFDREGPDGRENLCGKGGDDYLETGDGDSADLLYGGAGSDVTEDHGDGDVTSGGDHGSHCV